MIIQNEILVRVLYSMRINSSCVDQTIQSDNNQRSLGWATFCLMGKHYLPEISLASSDWGYGKCFECLKPTENANTCSNLKSHSTWVRKNKEAFVLFQSENQFITYSVVEQAFAGIIEMKIQTPCTTAQLSTRKRNCHCQGNAAYILSLLP